MVGGLFGLEAVQVFGERTGKEIIAGHDFEPPAGARGEAVVKGLDLALARTPEDADSRIPGRLVLQEGQSPVRRMVIDDDELPIAEGLALQAPEHLPDVRRDILRRHEE
jgi:hypothetical protein